MPTARAARTVQEDNRVEATTSKERQPNISSASKGRRQATAAAPSGTTAKITTTATATATANTTTSNADNTQGINWASESLSTLNAYRVAHRLDTPPAYQSPTAAAVLAAPGIGKSSPTMVRRKDKHKVSKEHLATAVRKHFNAVAVTETDVLVDFMNKAKNQGKTFRARTAPKKQK